jgi:hypothetical protein
MTAEPDAIRYRKIRAPRQDGAALIEPPLAAAVEHLRDSAARRPAVVWGMDVEQARARLLELARQYTSTYRDVPVAADAARRPLILAGHQPTLFHPGVWFKNFLLSSLANRAGGTAVNLVIDNDTLRAPGIRVPAGSPEVPRLETVLYDEPVEEIPFEERPVLDPETFDLFGRFTVEALAPLLQGAPLPSYTPLLERLWPEAVAARKQRRSDASLGWLLAEARHRLEGQLGLQTLELPLSVLCDTEEFRRFVWTLLSEAPRLVSVYNASLAEYRAVNHIRSTAHPVPDLEQEDDWLEAPLWIWSRHDPRRRRLFVRLGGERMEISDRAHFSAAMPGSVEGVMEQLAALRAQGIKIRPRALATTMFARVLLSDLFIHGIGGAKYDELTDAILRRLFELDPPLFVTATATFQLPIARPAVSLEDLRGQMRQLRDTRYHGERFADRVPAERVEDFKALANRKRELIESGWPEGEKGAWHRELARCNSAMSRLLHGVRAELQADQPRLAAELQIEQRLGSREFSFCLFPEETLPDQLRALAEGSGVAALL